MYPSQNLPANILQSNLIQHVLSEQASSLLVVIYDIFSDIEERESLEGKITTELTNTILEMKSQQFRQRYDLTMCNQLQQQIHTMKLATQRERQISFSDRSKLKTELRRYFLKLSEILINLKIFNQNVRY